MNDNNDIIALQLEYRSLHTLRRNMAIAAGIIGAFDLLAIVAVLLLVK